MTRHPPPAPSGRRLFSIRREVLAAYLAPALSAGAGGLVTGQHALVLAAMTSIAGSSAAVALLTGLWLQRRRGPRPWTLALPRAALATTLSLVAAAAGAAVAWSLWLASGRLAAHTALAVGLAPWFGRLRIDLPLSAALAAAVVSWRWRGSRPRRP